MVRKSTPIEFKVRLSKEEHRVLLVRAKARGVSPTAFLRSFVSDGCDDERRVATAIADFVTRRHILSEVEIRHLSEGKETKLYVLNYDELSGPGIDERTVAARVMEVVRNDSRAFPLISRYAVLLRDEDEKVAQRVILDVRNPDGPAIPDRFEEAIAAVEPFGEVAVRAFVDAYVTARLGKK